MSSNIYFNKFEIPPIYKAKILIKENSQKVYYHNTILEKVKNIEIMSQQTRNLLANLSLTNEHEFTNLLQEHRRKHGGISSYLNQLPMKSHAHSIIVNGRIILLKSFVNYDQLNGLVTFQGDNDQLIIINETAIQGIQL